MLFLWWEESCQNDSHLPQIYYKNTHLKLKQNLHKPTASNSTSSLLYILLLFLATEILFFLFVLLSILNVFVCLCHQHSIYCIQPLPSGHTRHVLCVCSDLTRVYTGMTSQVCVLCGIMISLLHVFREIQSHTLLKYTSVKYHALIYLGVACKSYGWYMNMVIIQHYGLFLSLLIIYWLVLVFLFTVQYVQ